MHTSGIKSRENIFLPFVTFISLTLDNGAYNHQRLKLLGNNVKKKKRREKLVSLLNRRNARVPEQLKFQEILLK